MNKEEFWKTVLFIFQMICMLGGIVLTVFLAILINQNIANFGLQILAGIGALIPCGASIWWIASAPGGESRYPLDWH